MRIKRRCRASLDSGHGDDHDRATIVICDVRTRDVPGVEVAYVRKYVE
jgi:hypothetical protein